MKLNVDEKKKLGLFWREQRVAAGVSQNFVSQELGYSTAQFISNCERGISDVPAEKIERLTKLLKSNPQDVIGVYKEVYCAVIDRLLKNFKSYRR